LGSASFWCERVHNLLDVLVDPGLVQGSLSLFTFRSTQMKHLSYAVRPEKPEPLSPELERKSMFFEVISWQSNYVRVNHRNGVD
jgi:hypothetical protein